MSAVTSIEWTNRTWGPTRGCSRVSPGCDHCYAMRQAHRFDFPDGAYEGLTRVGSRGVDWSGRVVLAPGRILTEPLRWRKPQRVFVDSMSDLFHEALPDEALDRVLAVMALAGQHTFQVLTKRPKRMLEYVSRLAKSIEPLEAVARAIGYTFKARALDGRSISLLPFPVANVWLGVSVEDQATADERIPLLLQTPAAVRFVSYEPAIGPVDFRTWLSRCPDCKGGDGCRSTWHNSLLHLHQVIVGGESGPGARPFDLAWARSVVRQCREAGVACFVKQLGRIPTCAPEERHGTEARLDGRWTLDGGRPVLLLKHAKGGDPAEWPEDLRVREFPVGRS